MQPLWTFLGAVVFYTRLPLPARWPLNFVGIARWAPVVGVGIGALLAIAQWGLAAWGFAPSLRGVLVVALWLWVTGGLHFDGAMDTADGLAVPPERRLAVMADSRTGAFGVMAAGILLLLKVGAVAALPETAGWALLAAAGWGRWGQLVAIARDPYLRPGGKGALHKEAIRSVGAAVPTGIVLLGLGALQGWFQGNWPLGLGLAVTGGAIALLTGLYFRQRLGGQTGDTYGAIVEWTEAIFLVLATQWWRLGLGG